jgi:GNAT superfamily N-acetyltransferase
MPAAREPLSGRTKLDYRIREARVKDLSQILSIYREAGIDIWGSLTLKDARKVYKKMKGYPNYKVYLAESDGVILGTFALLIMDNLANGGIPSGVVEDVAVAPASQGKGIGKAMMQFAINECQHLGCYKMMLSTNKKRKMAHKFYESLGFSRHGFSYRVALLK